MADITRTFSVEDGITFGDDFLGILHGTFDPSVMGQTAPVGSLFLQVQNSQTYIKVAAGDTDWRRISATPRRIMSLSALRA